MKELLIKIGQLNKNILKDGIPSRFKKGDIVMCHFADELIQKDYIGIVTKVKDRGFYEVQCSEDEKDIVLPDHYQMKAYNIEEN